MEYTFIFTSAVAPIQALMGEAYFLSHKGMEEKEILQTEVTYQGISYPVQVEVVYEQHGLNSTITATTGNTQLTFEATELDTIEISRSGEELPRQLINKIALEVMRLLEEEAGETEEEETK